MDHRTTYIQTVAISFVGIALASAIGVLCFQIVEDRKYIKELERKLKTKSLIQERPPLVSATRTKDEIRIWMDGAFDMFHYGHMNAFRQGKSLGAKLVVGVNSDETIALCKGGKPITSDEERIEMVKSCRWVDEVVGGVPYIMNDDYLIDTVLKIITTSIMSYMVTIHAL